MPTLKMKTKSSTDCLREGHSLHASCKSSKISKVSHFQVKGSQKAAGLSTCIQNSQDVSSIIGVSGRNSVTTEAIDLKELFAGASTQFSKLPLSSPDSTSAGRTESLSVTCPSTLETIFSPMFEHSVQCKPINYRDEVVDDEHPDLPHLVADDSDDGSCSSSDYQACDISDYHISDLSSPALSFDGDIGFSDIRTDFCPDYECINSDVMFDMSDRYMILPFIDKPMETNNIHGGDSVDESVMNSDDACLYLAIHQMKSSEQEAGFSCQSGDLDEEDCFDPQSFIRNLPDMSEAVSALLPIWLPKDTRIRKPITLVLDLDETLVHSTLEHCDDANFTFPVFFNMKEHTVYVRQRPFLKIFLERVAQMFEIVIFTASQSIYAEQLLDMLDPEKKLISRRMYRESCVFTDGSYTKDLSILGVELAKVVIVDNSPQVFQLQVNNGIPIKSWFNDPTDHALISLLSFLETLVDADDVRPIIAKRYNNKE